MLPPSGQGKSTYLDGRKRSPKDTEEYKSFDAESQGKSSLHDSPDVQAYSTPSFADKGQIDQYNTLLNILEIDSFPSNGLTPQDRQLMMHWCTSTYRSISWNSAVEPVWQTIVPREALRYPSLMHGMLAFSALHLAFTRRADRESYLETAQSHHNQAIASCDSVTKSFDSPNCILLSTIMTMLSFSFSRLRLLASDVSAVGDLVQIFQHVRDSIRVPMKPDNGVESGVMARLIPLDEHLPLPDTSQFAIQSLQRLNTVLCNRNPQHEKGVYDVTIQHLCFSFRLFMTGGDGTIGASLWISRIPSRFMDLLKERQPLALVILGHFIVILHSLRRQWWIGEWSTRVLDDIARVLDGEWRESITWVMDATGCYVPTN